VFRSLRDERGAVLVEFAILLVPLIMITVTGLLLGLDAFAVRMAWMEINFAAEAAARCAALGNANCLTPAATASYAASLVKVINVPSSAFQLTPAPCGSIVTANYSYTPPYVATASFFANFLPTTIWISTSACYPT
jgi:Flp pilus assembly protein TadG